MSEPRYVTIYCSNRALQEARFAVAHPQYLGRCFAEKVDGRWRCCCCGKPVAVAW